MKIFLNTRWLVFNSHIKEGFIFFYLSTFSGSTISKEYSIYIWNLIEYFLKKLWCAVIFLIFDQERGGHTCISMSRFFGDAFKLFYFNYYLFFTQYPNTPSPLESQRHPLVWGGEEGAYCITMFRFFGEAFEHF